MKAVIKNNKKIVLNQIDISERALIDDFVKKSLKRETKIRALFDIDNELDGISFELTNVKKDIVNFKTPCIQVITAGSASRVDLEVDEETTINYDIGELEEFLEVTLDNKIIVIKALVKEELIGTTGQYIINVTLEKEGYKSAVVPINISVLYIKLSGSYTDLDNLPQINQVTLIGDRNLEELGIQEEMNAISNSEIDSMF